MIRPAAYFETAPSGAVVCRLCPHNCRIKPGKAGICDCRVVQDSHLVTTNYGELVTLAVDPIEKKPLYHFHPGSSILSTGANGCNLKCLHCQNWGISQCQTETTYCSPERLEEIAAERATLGVAFTYTEPVIWFEYIRDVAPLLREIGQKVVLVTNGYINPDPWAELLPLVDAANIDLKSIRPGFYKTMCKGTLDPVIAAIRAAVAAGVHVELTNLIIPNRNDSREDIAQLVELVASISDGVPLHFSAYHPSYKLNEPPTPAETLLMARDIAIQRLKYVFLGNLSLEDGSDSVCPSCGNVLIRRSGYRTRAVGVAGGKCTKCGGETGIIQ